MSEAARLPTHLEISGLIRTVETAGGSAMVLAKGHREAGTLLVLCCAPDGTQRLFERMPGLNGGRSWCLAKECAPEAHRDMAEYCSRRHAQDPDGWIVELIAAEAERFLP